MERKKLKAVIPAAGPRLILALGFQYYSYTPRAAILAGRAKFKL